MEFDALFDGKYRIIRLLGAGGCGRVYLAENTRLKSLWAIKEIICDETKRAQVEREIDVLKKTRHPALPRIVDVLREDGRIYLIEDYFEGRNAEDILKECGRVDARTAVKWALEICGIMAFLHGQKPEPIIYRDLKPSNIILSPEGAVRLIDFGSVRHYRAELPSDTIYIGTRGYAAPEQYGLGQSTKQTDIYNFGMTMLHIVTGKSPLTGVLSDAEVNAGAGGPAGGYKKIHCEHGAPANKLLDVFYKCVESDPADRYKDFNEVRAALSSLGRAPLPLRGGGSGLKASEPAPANRGEASPPMKKTAPPQPDAPVARPKPAPRRETDDLPRPSGIYRCAAISVVQNHEFAFEFAQRASEHYKRRTLVLDLDFETTLSEWYFQAADSEKRGDGENSLLHVAGLIERAAGNAFADIGGLARISRKHAGVPEVVWLNEPNPEYAGKTAELLIKNNGYLLRRLLTEVTVQVDLCLLLTGRSIFGELNALCFENSHYVICPGRAEIPSIKAFNNTALLAEQYRGIPASRFKYIMWNSRNADGVDTDALWELAGGSLAGVVRESRRRDASQRGGIYGKCYMKAMERAVKKDYDEIITALGLAANG